VTVALEVVINTTETHGILSSALDMRAEIKCLSLHLAQPQDHVKRIIHVPKPSLKEGQ